MNKTETKSTASMTVLAEITSRLAAITDDQIIEPQSKPEEGETPVEGEFTPELKRMLTLRRLIFQERKALKKEIGAKLDTLKTEVGMMKAMGKMMSDDDGTFKAFTLKDRRLSVIEDAVEGMFWEDLRQAFPDLADKERIGVNQGWKPYYVERPASRGLDILDILGGLDGGIIIGLGDGPFGRKLDS